MQKVRGQDLVIVSGEFGRYPSSIEHMARRLAVSHRILWIELTGMRRPAFSMYDARRAAGKIMRLARGAQRTESGKSRLPDNISIASPFTIPFPESLMVQRFNNEKLLNTIAHETAALGFSDFGLITTLPMAAGSLADRAALTAAGAAWTMYYCPDEWALWPGMNFGLVNGWEKVLLETVDSIVVPSEHLRVSKSRGERAAAIVRHGVDVDHFARAFNEKPADKITFFGLFDDRMDQELLAKVAQRFPGFTIELIGPVQATLKKECLADNISFTGPIPYDRLPEALADARILILPYVRNELTDNINPLKARECLATGKPVVATALPELQKLDFVFTADNHSEFIAHLERLISGSLPYDSRAAIKAMRPHSWDARACELLTEGQSAGDRIAVARERVLP